MSENIVAHGAGTRRIVAALYLGVAVSCANNVET